MVWFNHKEPDYVTLSKANFSDEEFASLRSADPSNFTPEQQKILHREMADAAWANMGPFIKFTSGLAGGGAGSAGAASGFTFGAAGRQAERLPPVLFGYTSEQTGVQIMRNGTFGLPNRPLYLTNNGSLSPLQAQLELALPPQNTARALFAIDSQALSRSSLLLSRRVTGNVFGRPGGRFETLMVNEPKILRDYGQITGSFRGPDLTK